MRSLRRSMCAAILALQAVALGLSTPVLIAVSDVGTGTALAVGLGLTVACLVVAGALRSPAGYAAGWAIQVVAVAMGFLVPAMFVVGLVFGALWATAYLMGGQIDTERAARSQAG